MPKAKRLPIIASLIDDSKYRLRIGTLIGLKFKNNTVVRAVIEQNGDSQVIGLRFSKAAGEDRLDTKTIMFEGAIDLIDLPAATAPTKTIAEAIAIASDESTLEKVSGNLFAAVIALYGNVSLERYKGDDDYDVQLTIRAGGLTAISTLPFAELETFLEKAPFEEGTDEWELEEMEAENERIRCEPPEAPTVALPSKPPTAMPPLEQVPYNPCTNCAERLTGVAGEACLDCPSKGSS